MIAAILLASATAPVAPAWRWIVPLAVLVLGGWQWWNYLRRRPQAAAVSSDGRLVLLQDGGRAFDVSDVRIGSINPALLAARCRNSRGEVLDMFLPGSTLSSETHRLLRKTLLALPANSGPDGRQTDEARGR